jgi:excisionase family DNA binding protein
MEHPTQPADLAAPSTNRNTRRTQKALSRRAKLTPALQDRMVDPVTHRRLAYTINNACVALDLGRSTLYQLIAAGAIRAIKVGRRTLIAEEELLSFLNSCGER